MTPNFADYSSLRMAPATRSSFIIIFAMLTTLVKISNVTNLSDARYCAGMGVDMLGFSMDESSLDYVDPTRFAEIRGWLVGVQIVGETTETDLDRIRELLDTYQPDILQVDDPTLLPTLSVFGKRLILRVNLTHQSFRQLNALAANPTNAEYMLLESTTSVPFTADLKLAIGWLATRHPVLLGMSITSETVYDRLTELPIRGIALTGGPEDRPGSRDFGDLMDILEMLDSEQ